nr:retrovirus-related Pol polyprotein from transposon TNT 1-94 [Tanacetum cinerariifolium]
MSRHTTGKKRATLIVIPSIRFSKLIIHHLQRRHKFHPRPDSPLHLSNEEPVLGYLKFSAKGSKREVFGMPIPGSLITLDIQTASYYQEYLASVAKHRKYLAGETRSHLDSPAPMPTKPARKPKSSAPKAPPRPSVFILVTSAQPAPTSAPAKPQEKKRKLATETSDKPPKAKKSKYGWVSKKCSLKHEATSEAEDVPVMEPQVAAEDAELQKVLEESMKTAYALPRGKGKAKVSEEHVAHDLLSLQKPKKKSPADQYILQRRIFEPTGSSLYDDSPYAVLGQSDSEEESEKVVLGATEGGQAGSNPDEMSEGQAGPDLGNAGDEEKSIPSHVVHAGSDCEHMDLDVADVSPQPSMEQLDEGFTATAYPKIQESLKLAVEEQVLLEEPASSSGTLSFLQHLSRDISFGDQFFSDKPSDANKNAKTKVESMVNVPIQQALSSISLITSPIIDLTSRPEYPKVHQRVKSTTTDITTTTTLPLPQAQQQSTAEAMMERLDKHRARLYTLEQLDIPQQVSIVVSEVVTDAVDWAMQAPLRNRFRDLPEADMKETLHQRMWETESYKTHKDHKQLFEALEKSINHDHSEELAQDLAEARKKKKRVTSHLKRHLGLHLIIHLLLLHQRDHPDLRELLELSDHLKHHHHHHLHLHPPFKKVRPKALLHQALPSQLPQLNIKPGRRLTSDSGHDEAIGSAHIHEVNLRQGLWKPLEEERPATPEPAWLIPSTNAPVPPNNWASALVSSYSPPPEDSLLVQTSDIATFIDWFCKRRGITELKPQDLEGPAFEIIKVCHPDVIHLQYQMEECHKLLTDSVDDPILRNNVSKPLPLGGPPGQVTIQSDFFFNKDLEYLRYGSKGSRPALSISKIKAAYYPNVGLEQMDESKFKYEVLDQEGRGSVQGVHVRYSEAFEDNEDLPQPGELCWRMRQRGRLQTFEAYRMIKSFRHSRPLSDDLKKGRVPTEMELELEHTQQGSSYEVSVAVCSSLRSLKPKCTIESRAKRSSKIISLGHYSTLFASSHTVKSKIDIKSPTHYPCGIHEYLQGVPIEEEMSTLRFRMSMAKAENASLRGKIRTMKDIETITHSQEMRTRIEMERQLALVQEAQRQDRENFRKLQELVTSIHEYLQGVPIEEEMSTLRFRMSMAEAENASLRGKIRTMKAIEMITHSQERRTRIEMERQLALVQEAQRQDRENFRKLQENQATVQDGKVVVQNVQGRQNRGKGMNPRGRSTAGYGGAQNRVGNVNPGQGRPGQARPVKCYNCNGTWHIARNCTQPKRPQNSEYYKDKMLLMQAQENGVALDAEQLLFLAGGQDNAFDDDVDEQPDVACAHHEEHVTHDSVQLDHVVDSHVNYTSDSNMIMYDQYVKDNEPALYNGHEIIKDNHALAIVHNIEDTLEMAEITKKKINDKMNDPECVSRKVKIAPHDYSKENFLATFTWSCHPLDDPIQLADDNRCHGTSKLIPCSPLGTNTLNNGPLLLPPAYHQYTSSSSGIQFNMTRKLEATGVSWMNSEFTQSIHTFIEDKRYMSRHTTGKKRATLIVIPSIRFNKLIIHHLQRRHKFHPRPDSSLHLPNEEPVLGYLKFSAKGSKREVFGMPIPGSLITLDIQTASYYQEYLASMAKHRKYLAGETGSHLDSPAPMPTKPARKPKSSAPKAPPRPSVFISVTSAQPAPTSAPAKPQEKKRKLATETSDKPPKAKKSKYGWVSKKRYLKHEATSEAEDVPVMEPQVAAKDAELQKERGKGKAKVSEEHVAHDLLSLQKPKKKSPADQYILQRRIFKPTRSSLHDDSPYAVLGQSDSEEESEKVVLGATKGGNDEDQAGPDPGAQAKGQTKTNAGTLDEGQAGSNPDKMSEGQARPDLGNAEDEEKSIPSHVVHAGSDCEHMNLDVVDVSPQPSTEQLDEGFTATAYPKIQESLKLAVEEEVLLEEPASSSGTLSSLQHLIRDISFGDQFFSDKPSDANKNAETKVESMVNVPIQQALSSVSLMTSPIIDLTSRPESPKVHQQVKSTTTDITTTTTLPPPQAQQQSTAEAMMVKRIGELEHIMANLIQMNKDIKERLDKHKARLYTLEQLDIPQQVSIAVSEVVMNAVDWAMQAPLRNRFRDLPEADMKEILHQRMWETESYKTHKDHKQLFEALEKSMNHDHSEELAQDLAEAHKKNKKSHESPKTPHGSPSHHPPPPPPPAGPSGPSGAP